MRTILISLITLALAGGCSLFVDFEPQDKTKETNCRDGVDNDGDGATDCEDPDCWTASNCTGEICDNGIDDEPDGFLDCEDPECFDFCFYEECTNGIDDDGDTLVDCDDPECSADPHCTVTGEICDNNRDDDGDNQVDCDDSDCTNSPFCIPREICRNDIDDDGDTLIDCEDDECWGLEGCNYPDGEYDCGNANDDDVDGLVDCMDPDCDDIILCQQSLSPCVAHVPFSTNSGPIYYYKDIYQGAMSMDCDANFICAIRPEVSLIPHCYPPSENVSTAYQTCGSGVCGPGLVCAAPGPMQQELCLPLCAPGYNTQCVGSGSLCFFHWMNNFDNHIDKTVELWTCGRPMCDPMNLTNNGCNPSSAGCYPSTDLFGDAVCVVPAGTTPLLMPCPSGDHECMPGHVCRMDDNVGEPVCRKLCKDAANCNTGTGTACHRDDSRQFFGYCR